jgi:hypothetical protein
MLSIGITTFERRIESLARMVKFLKSCDPDIKINIAINGEISKPFSESYRKSLLSLALEFSNIYLTFHQEFRSLAKLWNTLVINSVDEYNLILNDDLVFDTGKNLIQSVKDLIKSHPDIGCLTINRSFSHFLITKEKLDQMNYFDERFLLHGEEDGDFVWRWIDKFMEWVPNVDIPIVANMHQVGIEDETMILQGTEIGYGKKPKFNQEFTITKYTYDPTATISGLYGRPHRRVLGDDRQYPYESFFRKNKHNFEKLTGIVL